MTTEFKRFTNLRRLAENVLCRFGECLDCFHAGRDSYWLSARLEYIHEHLPEAKGYERGADYLQAMFGFAGQIYSGCIQEGEISDLDRIEAVVVNRLPPIRFLGRQYATAFESATSLGPSLCYCARGTVSAASADVERFREATIHVYSVIDSDVIEFHEDACDTLMADYRNAVCDLRARLAQEWQLVVEGHSPPQGGNKYIEPERIPDAQPDSRKRFEDAPEHVRGAIDHVNRYWKEADKNGDRRPTKRRLLQDYWGTKTEPCSLESLADQLKPSNYGLYLIAKKPDSRTESV